jgi:hypothetical protein
MTVNQTTEQHLEYFDKAIEFTEPDDTVTDGKKAENNKPAETTPTAKKPSGSQKNNSNKPSENEADLAAAIQKANEQLDKLIIDILHFKHEIIGKAELKIGENLKIAKGIVTQYKMSWSGFLAKCGSEFHPKKASRLIGLYEVFGKESGTTVSIAEVGGVQKAIELCKLDKPEREAFIRKTHSITDSRGNTVEKGIKALSVRDVRELLGNFKNPQKKATNDNKAEKKELLFPMNEYKALFQSKPSNLVIAEICKAILFYREHKGKIKE